MTAALTASCPTCGGIKAVECDAQDNNDLVQSWIDRGDIVGAETVSWSNAVKLWRCECEQGGRDGD